MPEEPTPPQPEPPRETAAEKTTPQTTSESLAWTPVEPTASGATAATAKPAAVDATLPPAIPTFPDTGYTVDGVPTFDGVREKIETRYGTAIGATELAEESREGRTAAQQFDARKKAAEEKLAEIRASMHKAD